MGERWVSGGCLLKEEDLVLGRQGLPPPLPPGLMDALWSPFGPGGAAGGCSAMRANMCS